MAEKKKSKQLTFGQRLKIEALHKAKLSNAEIAEQIGCTRQTVWRELKRGAYEHTRGKGNLCHRQCRQANQE